MKNFGKIIRNCSINRLNFKSELNNFLRSYRDTPHASTGVAPAKAMFRYNARFSRLPSTVKPSNQDDLSSAAKAKDAEAKSKMKAYADKRNRARSSDLKVGDYVLLDCKRGLTLVDKKLTRFKDENYVVTHVKGSLITASNQRHSITRNSSFFKKCTFEQHNEYFEN